VSYTLENAISKQTLRGRRSWCYSVLNNAGERVGVVRKRRTSWVLAIMQKQFIPTKGSMADWAGITNAPVKGFKTLAAVRVFLRDPDFAPSK